MHVPLKLVARMSSPSTISLHYGSFHFDASITRSISLNTYIALSISTHPSIAPCNSTHTSIVPFLSDPFIAPASKQSPAALPLFCIVRALYHSLTASSHFETLSRQSSSRVDCLSLNLMIPSLCSHVVETLFFFFILDIVFVFIFSSRFAFSILLLCCFARWDLFAASVATADSYTPFLLLLLASLLCCLVHRCDSTPLRIDTVSLVTWTFVYTRAT